MSNPESEFTYDVWVRRGNMLVRRDALDCDDPESVWMLWWDRFQEVMPMYICDQIWGEDCITEQEYDHVKQTFERHEERLLIEAGAILTD